MRSIRGMSMLIRSPFTCNKNATHRCYVSRNSNEFYDGDISRLLALPGSPRKRRRRDSSENDPLVFPEPQNGLTRYYKSHNENLTIHVKQEK